MRRSPDFIVVFKAFALEATFDPVAEALQLACLLAIARAGMPGGRGNNRCAKTFIPSRLKHTAGEARKKIQAAVTIAHGGLLFPPDIPQNSAKIDLPAKPPSLFPKSSCSLRPSNYKGIRSAEFQSFSGFSRSGVRSCEGLASNGSKTYLA